MANRNAKMGRLIAVDNRDRAFGANPTYVALWVQDTRGNAEECLLFTEGDIIRARARAAANKEDLTRRTLLNDMLD